MGTVPTAAKHWTLHGLHLPGRLPGEARLRGGEEKRWECHRGQDTLCPTAGQFGKNNSVIICFHFKFNSCSLKMFGNIFYRFGDFCRFIIGVFFHSPYRFGKNLGGNRLFRHTFLPSIYLLNNVNRAYFFQSLYRFESNLEGNTDNYHVSMANLIFSNIYLSSPCLTFPSQLFWSATPTGQSRQSSTHVGIFLGLSGCRNITSFFQKSI